MANDGMQTLRLDAPASLVEGLVADRQIRARWAPDESPVTVEADGSGTRLLVRSEADWSGAFSRLTDLVTALRDSEREINIVRVLRYPLERVFKAFSNPAGMAQWWGPNGFRTTTHSMSFKVGGSWDYTMHGPDGTDYPNFVRYTAIEPNRRITYDHGSHADRPALFKAVIGFSEFEDGTRVSLKLILADAKERPGYVAFGAVEGGYQNLERLERWLDSGHT